jgi:hypothetical protein
MKTIKRKALLDAFASKGDREAIEWFIAIHESDIDYTTSINYARTLL